MGQAPEEFANAEGIQDLLIAQPAVWVPPTSNGVAVKQLPLSEDIEAPYLIYHVPPDWGPEVTETGIGTLSEWGWAPKPDTSDLLYDFLKLAEYEDDAGDTIGAVKTFGEKWGPIWLCQTPGHMRFFDDCHCSPATYGGHYGIEPCSWNPFEPVYDFVRKAQEAKAVLDAFNLLRTDKPVPDDLWIRLNTNRLIGSQMSPIRRASFSIANEAPIPYQRLCLTVIVHEHLGDLGTPRLWLKWAASDQPELKLLSGLGFIRAVWTDIAQIMGDAHGWYRCDGCERWYLRTGRKPQGGRRNYCDGRECGAKAARRDWWRKNRGKKL